jgi:hypothetical protein
VSEQQKISSPSSDFHAPKKICAPPKKPKKLEKDGSGDDSYDLKKAPT